MDAPLTMDEAVECFESLLRDDPAGDQVAADLDEVSMDDVAVVRGQMADSMAQLIRANDDDDDNEADYDDQAHFFGPLPAPVYDHMGGPWVGATQLLPSSLFPEATIQQPMVQHPVIPQPTVDQTIVQQPVVQQAAIPQPAAQQSSTQQPGPRDRSCPVQGCHYHTTRSDHLYDHLAASHGYDKAYREYSVNKGHLMRKIFPVLRPLFVRDARKLAWSKARLLAVEEAIRKVDISYVSRHGLGLAMPHSINQANACPGKTKFIDLLIAVRNEINQKGRLYNQTGSAQSSWQQVYQNLIATFQIDQNAEQAVARRTEQIFHQFRNGMGDDMTEFVDAARVNRTDELVLKPGASLPPK